MNKYKLVFIIMCIAFLMMSIALYFSEKTIQIQKECIADLKSLRRLDSLIIEQYESSKIDTIFIERNSRCK